MQATVTLASVRPIAKADALYVLENALRMSGVALVRDRSGGYRLLPANEAGPGSIDRSATAEAGLDALAQFDRVFAVLDDHDAEWTKFTLDWAEREGRLGEASAAVLATRGVTDEKIQALVDERDRAKRTRNFARADAIRNELAGIGILLEDSKEGTRWKRK